MKKDSMRQLLLAGACAGMLAAGCTPGDQEQANADNPTEGCAAMLAGDPEIAEDLNGFGTSVDGYCSCYAAKLDGLGDEDKTAVLKVTRIIADLREEKNIGLEDAAELIEDDAEGDPEGQLYAITSAEFETTGEFVDDVRRDLRENDGACSVSTAA